MDLERVGPPWKPGEESHHGGLLCARLRLGMSCGQAGWLFREINSAPSFTCLGGCIRNMLVGREVAVIGLRYEDHHLELLREVSAEGSIRSLA